MQINSDHFPSFSSLVFPYYLLGEASRRHSSTFWPNLPANFSNDHVLQLPHIHRSQNMTGASYLLCLFRWRINPLSEWATPTPPTCPILLRFSMSIITPINIQISPLDPEHPQKILAIFKDRLRRPQVNRYVNITTLKILFYKKSVYLWVSPTSQWIPKM